MLGGRFGGVMIQVGGARGRGGDPGLRRRGRAIVALAGAVALLLGTAGRPALAAVAPIGIVLASALMGTIAWLLLDLGAIRLASPGDLGLILLYMLAGLLAAGVSWMRVWTRLTGQASYDNLTK